MSKRKSRSNKELIYFLISLVLLGMLFLFPKYNEKENINNTLEISNKIENPELEIYFLDVGQADSQLIQCNKKTMLIDAGNNEDGKKIVEFLKEKNIESIDYLIGTHPHEDHIGGLDDVIENFNIGTVYMPYNETVTTKTYEDVLDALIDKNLEVKMPNIGDSFNLGEANCKIVAVDNTQPENINNSSIVIEISYKTQKYLFMGDAESKVEEKIDCSNIDVLKVGHHGSQTSSSKEFLNKIKPKISIISVGKSNSYGLPKQNIIDRLKEVSEKIYRTDEDGTIYLASNGDEIYIEKLSISLDGN